MFISKAHPVALRLGLFKAREPTKSAPVGLEKPLYSLSSEEQKDHLIATYVIVTELLFLCEPNMVSFTLVILARETSHITKKICACHS